VSEASPHPLDPRLLIPDPDETEEVLEARKALMDLVVETLFTPLREVRAADIQKEFDVSHDYATHILSRLAHQQRIKRIETGLYVRGPKADQSPPRGDPDTWQAALLDALTADGPLTVKAVAERFGKTRAAAHKVLNRLRQKGLVIRPAPGLYNIKR
jgi:predicted transcriptional regulator of viral defense system